MATGSGSDNDRGNCKEMAIDFSDILYDDDDVVLDPRDIFLTLETGPGRSFLRDIQSDVMNQWFEHRDSKDNVIKLNVGSGKTLVGLLLLQSSLNETKGPALYVASDRQLVRQVLHEAAEIGINVTEDPADPAYGASESICVVNIYKLFNGKSVFGVGASQIDIGTVVIDDAHACVSTVSNQFRLRIEHKHEAYREIRILLEEDLRGYNEALYLEVESGDPHAYLEVPFWSWAARLSEVVEVLAKHRFDRALEFGYPLLRDVLQQCRCFIGGRHLEIEPFFPPTDIIQSFRRSKRRIYMTATLSDDTPIVTHFGADPSSLGKPIVPSSPQSMGERMILMPQELDPSLAENDIRGMLAEIAKDVNVVAIVPSSGSADRWCDEADQILIGDNVAPAIEKLREGHAGLTVLVNRYDGVDLPGDACRVLALAGLPEVSSLADASDSEILGTSSVNLRRQVERIEQGMGRGIRSNDDYCAVLLLGGKLIGRLRSPEGHKMLTPATQAQVELSRRIARSLENPSLGDIKSVIAQCLNRDPGWRRFSKRALLNLSSNEELILDPSKLALRRAFDLARSNQYSAAAAALDGVIDETSDQQVKAWLLSRKAALQHWTDAQGAQQTLAAAHGLEPRVLRPLRGITYRRIPSGAGEQASMLIENHQQRFLDGTAMQLFAETLCTDLRFIPGTSGKFEAAIDDLAWFLGISGQRPENAYNEGPDNLWALPNATFLVIECKNEVAPGNAIAKRDVGQLGQSVEWFRGNYFASDFVPVLVHRQRTLGAAASPVDGMRVIDQKGLRKLRARIKDFAQQLASPDVSYSVTEVAQRLAQLELNANAFVGAFTGPVKL